MTTTYRLNIGGGHPFISGGPGGAKARIQLAYTDSVGGRRGRDRGAAFDIGPGERVEIEDAISLSAISSLVTVDGLLVVDETPGPREIVLEDILTVARGRPPNALRKDGGHRG